MRSFISAAAVAALPLLAACSAASPPATSATAVPTASSAANPDAGLLTGTELKSLLAPASWFPAGFSADQSGAVNSGSAYQPPSPAGRAPDCALLDATGWVQLSGVGGVSFAQSDYIDRNTSEQYAQEIDVYRGTSAQDVMAGLRKLARMCPSFKDPQTSSTVTVKLKKGPRLGDDALSFLLKSPRWAGGSTLEAVRVGTAVVTVFYSSSSGSGKAQAVKLASAITGNLRGKT